MDVWLWRARLFKTRAMAASAAQAGRIRRTRLGVQRRVEKASDLVRVGDELIFASGGRLTALRVAALGARRGPATEARTLFQPLDSE